MGSQKFTSGHPKGENGNEAAKTSPSLGGQNQKINYILAKMQF